MVEVCRFSGRRGFTITCLRVDQYGPADPDDVRKAATAKTILISIIHAGDEVGTIEPISEIGKIAKRAQVCLHTDGMQAAGHIPVDVDKLKVDQLSILVHRFCEPEGVGAPYVRKGTELVSLMQGGEQENRRRAGTENAPAILGLGKAVAEALVVFHPSTCTARSWPRRHSNRRLRITWHAKNQKKGRRNLQALHSLSILFHADD